MATLEVRSLSRAGSAASELPAVVGVSFTVREGRICAVAGAPGSGKTALLRLLAGLDARTDGDVLLDGQSIADQAPHRRGVGLMFQDLALFPHLDVRENIAFGLRMVGWPRAEREQRVNDLLEVVGLAALGSARIDDLTDGERQRVALARTLAPQPSVLLLDEPLGAIDETARARLRVEVRAVLNALESTAIFATRDLQDAAAMADDLVILGEGRVLQAGPVGVVLGEPASVEVAELAGYVTLAHGPVRRGRVEEAGVGAIAVPDVPETEAARVMAHPSALLAVPADSGLGSGIVGAVVRTRALGPTWCVDIAIGNRVVETRWEWDLVPPRTGTRLAIAARPGTLRVFVTSLVDLPAPGVPSVATSDAAPPSYVSPRSAPPPPSPSTVVEAPVPDSMDETPAPPAFEAPASNAPARPEQRHREMPLN